MEQIVLKDSSDSWDGTRLPKYPIGGAHITVSRIRLAVGERTNWHEHRHIYAGYVLSGELTITSDDGLVITVGAGEAVVELTDKSHYGENCGTIPVEVVVFRVGS